MIGEYSVDDDPVLVPVKQSRPFEFLEKWKGDADLIGESVGLFKVHGSDLPMLVERELGAGAMERSRSCDEIIRAMVKAGRFMAEDVHWPALVGIRHRTTAVCDRVRRPWPRCKDKGGIARGDLPWNARGIIVFHPRRL
ncbi:MAG: hypothetical protein U1G07_22385 [Verrucomicrobiota bacterium]